MVSALLLEIQQWLPIRPAAAMHKHVFLEYSQVSPLIIDFFLNILSSVAYAFPLFEAVFFYLPICFLERWPRKGWRLCCIWIFFISFWPPRHRNKVAFGFWFAFSNQAATQRCYSQSNRSNYSTVTWRVVTCMCIPSKIPQNHNMTNSVRAVEHCVIIIFYSQHLLAFLTISCVWTF